MNADDIWYGLIGVYVVLLLFALVAFLFKPGAVLGLMLMITSGIFVYLVQTFPVGGERS